MWPAKFLPDEQDQKSQLTGLRNTGAGGRGGTPLMIAICGGETLRKGDTKGQKLSGSINSESGERNNSHPLLK